jgi:hypothetical protein
MTTQFQGSLLINQKIAYEELEVFLLHLFQNVFALLVYFYFEKDVNLEFFDEIKKKVESKAEMKMILEKLEESIIIASNSGVQFVNDNFLK